MQVAIPLFPRFTALDAIGPYEVLQRLPDLDVVFVAEERGPVRTDNGMLAVVADATLDEVATPGIVVVPGGIGTRPLATNGGPLIDWLADVHGRTAWTTSVCTGSLLLAKAGILDGTEATTHWSVRNMLGLLGAAPLAQRVVARGKVITAAGVSSGIDMALQLVEKLHDRTTARAVQLLIEYDPQPPHDTGSLEKAPPEVVARAEALAEQRA